METFDEYLAGIQDPAHRQRVQEIFSWIEQQFPELETRIGWNQPMYTHHGTFIISMSAYKLHLAIAPETVAIERFSDDIKASGYRQTKMLFRIGWEQPVDYDLLGKIIAFNIKDKSNIKTFWRKPE